MNKYRKKIIHLFLAMGILLLCASGYTSTDVYALSEENLALNKTVTASSIYPGKDMNHVVDGLAGAKQTWQINYSDKNGYNRGNGDLNAWLMVDLASRSEVDRIDITWTASVWAKNIVVEGSLDGVNFFTIKEVTGHSITKDKQVLTIDGLESVETHFIKLNFSEPNNKTYGYELYEVAVYGSEVNDLARNKTVTASSIYPGRDMKHVVDGKNAAKETWQNNYSDTEGYNRGKGQLEENLTIDLGAVYYVETVDLTWTQLVWAESFTVEGSLDGTEYFTIREISGTSVSLERQVQVIEGLNSEVRYLKFNFKTPNFDAYSGQYGYELYEIAVYDNSERVEKAADLLETVKDVVPVIAEDYSRILLPEVDSENHEVVLYGSSNEAVVSLDGTIHRPLEDKLVNLSYKVMNKTNASDVAFDNYHEVSLTIEGLYTQSEEENKKPDVLPAIQEWKGHTGTFALTENSKLVISGEELRETAQMIAYYFEEMLEREISITAGTPEVGDIYLSLSDHEELGMEGYEIEIGDYVNVCAYHPKGILYAGATVTQILYQDPQHITLPKGLIRDYPSYEVRSMSIDLGRMYIPLDYLEEIAKYMAYFKMNELHAHINDNGGEQSYAFRLESKKYPQINSNLDPEEVYSQEAYKNFQSEVAKYGIDVVTEIDTPAHAGFVGLYDPSYIFSSKYIDLSKEEPVEFIKALFDEFLDGEDPVIRSTKFHIGVDEYPLEYQDAARTYANELIEYVAEKGYEPRLWATLGGSSGLGGNVYVSNKGVCNYWSPRYADSKQMIDDGYAAINNNRNYLYVVPGSDKVTNIFDLANSYTNWDVNDLPGVTVSTSTPLLKGAEAAYWYDSNKAISEFDAFQYIKDQFFVIAEKTWYGDQAQSAEEFEERIELLDDYTPGSNPLRYVETKGESLVQYDFEHIEDGSVKDSSENAYDGLLNNVQVKEYKDNHALELNGEGYLSLPFEAVGFPYTVSFDLFVHEQKENAVLFDGANANGTLYLNYESTGKIGFVRNDYIYTFDYLVPEGEMHRYMFTCDDAEMTLYVDGIRFSAAKSRFGGAISSTFVLPTEQIGTGVSGLLDNLCIKTTFTGYEEIMGIDTSMLVNLALNKPTEVSGLEVSDGRWTSDLAVDGDSATRVSFEKKNDAWFIVDLEDTYCVENIEIEFNEYPLGYEVYVSEEGDVWEKVYTAFCAGGEKGTDSIALTGLETIRYVKYQQIEMFTASNDRQYSGNFTEFRVIGSKESRAHLVLKRAKAILEATEVTEQNDEYLKQLSQSVNLIETVLSSNEQITIAINQLEKEIECFENHSITNSELYKDALEELLKDKISETPLYKYYYNLAVQVFVDSFAAQEEVDHMAAVLEELVASVNIALNKPVSAAVGDGYKVTDGIISDSNYWDGGKYPSSFTIDLEDEYYLTKVHVYPLYRSHEPTRIYSYEVYVSVDGEVFEKVIEKADGKIEPEGTAYPLDEVKARYIQVIMTDNEINAYVHMSEIEAFGTIARELDFTELDAVLETIEGLDDSLYTEETVDALHALVKIANETAFTKQSQVNVMVRELQKAIDALEEKAVVLEILKQPMDVTADKGSDATVFVEAAGKGLTYTWYYKNPGNVKFYESGTDFVSADGTAYTIPMYAWRDGQEVYCVVTDENGQSVQSNTVTLSMRKAAITIVTRPVDVCTAKGEQAVVSVKAEGEDLTYTWYYKNPGNVKFYVSGTDYVSEDGTQYMIPMAAWRNGQQVYCEITDANGDSVQTNIVTLTMAE